MNDKQPLPALRHVEATPFRREDGEVYFALRDPQQLAQAPIAVSAAALVVLTCMDGQRNCAAVEARFQEETGLSLPREELLSLVDVLDQALLLDNDRSAEALAARRKAYRDAPARDNRARYPDADTLRREIQPLVGKPHANTDPPIRGLLVPHLDYPRGGPCYAAAYRRLARSPYAQRYVILGTNHAGESGSVSATVKDYQTPLGLARVDRAFVEALAQRSGVPILEYEHDHLLEHSVELQVHVLQVLRPEAEFEIVPLLLSDVACSLPALTNEIRAVAGALRELLASSEVPTTVVAGADLSHVGQRFGEPEPTDEAFLEGVGASDRRLLDLLLHEGPDAFASAVAKSGNQTRICSTGCLFTLFAALPDARRELLRYHQAVDFDSETHVTCAAAVLY